MTTHRRIAIREISGVRMGHYGATYPPEDARDTVSHDRARRRFVVRLMADLEHYCRTFGIEPVDVAEEAHKRVQREKD